MTLKYEVKINYESAWGWFLPGQTKNGVALEMRRYFEGLGWFDTIELPEARSKDGCAACDLMFWVVGTQKTIRVSGRYKRPELDLTAIGNGWRCNQTTEILDVIRAVKDFLEKESLLLPFESGRELNRVLSQWPREARSVFVGVNPHYGLFINGGCLQWFTPSNRAVAESLAYFDGFHPEPIEIKIHGRDYDPEYGSSEWVSSYRVRVDRP